MSFVPRPRRYGTLFAGRSLSLRPAVFLSRRAILQAFPQNFRKARELSEKLARLSEKPASFPRSPRAFREAHELLLETASRARSGLARKR